MPKFVEEICDIVDVYVNSFRRLLFQRHRMRLNI
jgi:hypothetical protein